MNKIKNSSKMKRKEIIEHAENHLNYESAENH